MTERDFRSRALQKMKAAYREALCGGAHEEVVSANPVRPVADLDEHKFNIHHDGGELEDTNLDGWDTQPLNSMGVPETDASGQKNGFFGGQVLDNIVKVRVGKVRGSHGVNNLLSIRGRAKRITCQTTKLQEQSWIRQPQARSQGEKPT